MRDIMMMLAMFYFVPISMANGFIAFLLWGWSAVVYPNYYMYGFMGSMRFNMLFALISLTLLLMKKVKYRENSFQTRTGLLVMIFAFHATLCMIFSYNPNFFNETYYMFFIKAAVFSLVIPLFIDNRLKIHAFLIVIALGLGFHGSIEGLKLLASGGGHKIQGMSGTMLSDNNHFAVGMVIVIPVLYYLYQYSERKIVRMGFLIGMVLTIFSVLGTHSRGGFMSMAVVGAWIALTSRRKMLSVFMVFCMGALIMIVAPDSWFSRIESIQSAGEDSSFIGRLVAWNISSSIALSNPIFGGGFHALQNVWVWDMFKYQGGIFPFIDPADIPSIPKAAHSIYFEILGDLGFVGLFLFLVVMINGLITRNEIKRLIGERENLIWARDMADLLSVSVVAYLIGGAGVSLGYLEIIYVVVMLIEVIKQIVKNEIAQEKNSLGSAWGHKA